MSTLLERFFSTIILTVVAGFFWIIWDVITALVFYSTTLLLLHTYHLSNLIALEVWLKSLAHGTANLPNSSGAWGGIFSLLARLVRNQDQNQEQLNSALERLRRATAAMPEGIVILDEENRIEWSNKMAEQHFGINFSQDAYQQVTYLVRQPQFANYLLTRNYSEPLVMEQSRHHGLLLSLQLVPYGDKQKLLISHDVTRLREMEVMRQDFVANVSHELRTPLTVIYGFLEIFAEEDEIDSKMYKQAVVLMTEQANRMKGLLEDLLTLSQLENVRNQVHEEIIDMVDLLKEIYQETESIDSGRHHINSELNTDIKLLGSKSELRSVFSNLITNAIKYTPDEGTVTLKWEILGDGRGVFSVQDNGIGISSEHIPRLAERFYRVDLSRSRATGGTGLGLAIVKHALNRHQAELKIVSEIGKGSCFSAQFPSRRLIK
ncbi:MAG: phosphate regulon sensor histidine kinase PhoR [Nitrosospira sp.]|nr:phosphate regulon sensor histidine kinase PhoR [Nitrosospira sp.]MBI0414052.1 phosphate regulon sensor histidine kinase PhoR [Nitrosospira sp.]MBI0416881.1 phosphate regulon sensor histidine kinase PhoR [Nitrosospira sp.]